MKITIRPATLEDAEALPAIERSAGNSFRAIPDLAWVADDVDVPAQQHREHIALGTEWVAESEEGTLVGFLAAELIASELHLWELAVHADFQRQGIGGRLIDAAVAFARQRRADALTLTTFSGVPWNSPWYERLGFESVSDHPRLNSLLRAEAERGLTRRCAMRRQVHPSGA